MARPAIEVHHLSKRFRIGERQALANRSLRDGAIDVLKRPLQLARRRSEPTGAGSSFWALRDLSFEVQHGEVLGIIGRNGAGKSTLLKILSRITEPTSGRARIHGRVGSLLEVGTGFHPELTGRENIYLNGAILGMAKVEIDRKFDEIVAFAEVEQFLDTPVKHYSSGMYVRLAFAVAAHLESSILIVDEVLAVGDAAFQAKCLGKMGDVAMHGRTVILVSHSMASVASLCHSAILLDGGTISAIGPTAEVVQHYLGSLGNEAPTKNLRDRPRTAGTSEPRIVHAAILDRHGTPCSVFPYGSDICFELTVEPMPNLRDMICAVWIRTATGIPVLHLVNKDDPNWRSPGASERATIRCQIKDCKLYPGQYLVSFWVGPGYQRAWDFPIDTLQFRMEQAPLGRGTDLTWNLGMFHVASGWTVRDTEVRSSLADSSRVPQEVGSSFLHAGL